MPDRTRYVHDVLNFKLQMEIINTFISKFWPQISLIISSLKKFSLTI